jgi:hypothetical protein
MGIDPDRFELRGVDPSLAHPRTVYTIIVLVLANMNAHFLRLFSRLKGDPIGAPALVLQLAFHGERVSGKVHGPQRK